MPDVQKPTLQLEDIDRIKDQTQRAFGAIAYGAYAEERAKQARAIRDDAIRKLRKSGKTIPELSEITGLSVGMIRVVVR